MKGWSLLGRVDIPNWSGDGVYLTRWRVIETPLFAVFVHRFRGPDPRPTLHDHPWNFLSVVLRGGYVERRLDPKTLRVRVHRPVRLLNYVRSSDAHAIVSLDRDPTWTLLFVGRRRRTWGYLEQVGDHWVWTEFDKHRHNAEHEEAMRERSG